MYKIGKNSDSIDATTESSHRSGAATNRLTLALILLALAALGFEIYKNFDIRNQEQMPPDYRLPVANPPIEPDRPDLIGAARIDE